MNGSHYDADPDAKISTRRRMQWMLNHTWFLVTVLVGSLLLSGCISPLGELESIDGSDDLVPAEGYSTLTGFVITRALEPIASAEVLIHNESGLVATDKTTPDGRFLIKNLEPGDLNVQIVADCCKQSVERINLGPGEILDFMMQLDVLTQNDLQVPYVEQLEWTGFLSCTFRWIDVPPVPSGINLCHVVDGVGGIAGHENITDDDFMHYWTVRPGLKSVVGGMTWQSPGAALGDKLEIFMEPKDAPDMRYTRASGASPVEWRVDEGDILTDHEEEFHEHDFSNITEAEDIRYRVFAAGDLNVVYQQKFTVYWDLYYWEEATPGATALPEY